MTVSPTANRLGCLQLTGLISSSYLASASLLAARSFLQHPTGLRSRGRCWECAAPPSSFSGLFNTDQEEASAK